MDLSRIEDIANAVLYEGYILYPYRASAIKNRQRFNFGVLYPRDYGFLNSEAYSMQTECLILAEERSLIETRVRFLHLVSREDESGEMAWQEAVEREVLASSIELDRLKSSPELIDFRFGPDQEAVVPGQTGNMSANVSRQEAIKGVIEMRAADCSSTPATSNQHARKLFKLSVRIENLTALEKIDRVGRDEALLRSLISTHTILSVDNGAFISLLDPPEEFSEPAQQCHNIGTWPVLVGEQGSRCAMLSSPIILYDYPEIASESAGNLFDGTEIDEILTLRILTLTDDEKRELRAGDERARRLLDRTERLSAEQLMKLHGVMRSLKSYRSVE